MEDEIYKHVCKGCMFSTNSSAKWQRHLTTKKHYAMLKRQQKDLTNGVRKHVCSICNYSTNMKYDWNRHITSKRHITNLKNNDKLENTENKKLENKCKKSQHTCPYCMKIFNSRTTLWRHKKICDEIEETVSLVTSEPDKSSNSSYDTQALILEVLKQQSKCIEQMAETQKQNAQLIEQQKATIIGNNNNNNYININMFLNEECANAMSIQNFAKKLQLTIDDLAKTNKREAISNIVIKNLKPLSITERPVHFKDKCEWYIKDEEAGWNEDNGEKLIKAASYGIQRNWLKEFEKEYPTWMKNEKLRDLYVKLAGNSSSEINEREKLTILKEVAEACNLPKNIDEVAV